ncbi:MAG: PKD repeat protein [Psychroserpens sp.]|jgi:PKD repeat protein
MYKKIGLSAAIFSTLLVTAQQKSALFIGNSYTGVNNLPIMTKDLAFSLGDTLIIDSNTPGGTTFNSHSTNSTTLSKINQQAWDYVILQAQSQEPSFPPAQVASQTYPYAESLVNAINNNNPCTVPLFYMTWGRENGDSQNCSSYPVICTYDGMQSRLRESYLEMGDDNNAEVSPVGATWKWVRDNYPTIGLYSADESHPSIYGSYLAACVHYTSIYRKSPVGASYISGLSAADALILQQAAQNVVLDSLDIWGIGRRDAVADFTIDFPSSANLMEGLTNNSSTTGAQYIWNWGDGTIDTTNNYNSTHIFGASGAYAITLTVDDGCTIAQSTDTVEVIAMSIDRLESLEFNVYQTEHNIELKFNQSNAKTIKMFDGSGKLIFSDKTSAQRKNYVSNYKTGLYIVVVTQNGVSNYKKIIIN